MARGDLPALAALDVADAPEVWRSLGFEVGDDGTCVIGDVRVVLLGPDAGEGIAGWSLRSAEPLPATIDGILTSAAAEPPPPASTHPNGATGLDHVVVHTPDLTRTLSALEAAGMVVRRVREARPDLHQAFLWAGEVLVEVAGPPEPAGDAPATLWGLVVVAPDLDAVAALPAQPLGSVREAVQQGRRIATVRREVGSSVPLAFMTPHQHHDHTDESDRA